MFGWKVGVATVLAAIEKLRGEDVQDLKRQLEVAQVRNVLLEKQLATAQANVDWLRVLANTFSNDRAAIAAAKGIILPNPQIEGAVRTPAEIARIAEHIAGEVDRLKAKDREEGGGAPAVVGAALADAPNVDDALDAYRGHVNNFEDVGDDAAAELGIGHDAKDGTVEYSK
jgi:hypothetical protein